MALWLMAATLVSVIPVLIVCNFFRTAQVNRRIKRRIEGVNQCCLTTTATAVRRLAGKCNGVRPGVPVVGTAEDPPKPGREIDAVLAADAGTVFQPTIDTAFHWY